MSGRKWNAGYAFHAFNVLTTDKEFAFSRRLVSSPAAGSNLSAVYTPHLQECLINGVLQGRKQTDSRGGSALCNAQMWRVASSVAARMGIPILQDVLQLPSYRGLKSSETLEDRKQVKEETKIEALKGWVRNIEDDFEVPSVSRQQ